METATRETAVRQRRNSQMGADEDKYITVGEAVRTAPEAVRNQKGAELK